MSEQAELARILRQTRSIAVLGASADPARASNDIYRYLKATGHYIVWPVNPNIAEIDGDAVYPSLSALPETPDLVDVFRRRQELPSVLADVLALPQLPKTLWLQLGLRDEAVATQARAAGLQVVMDRCIKVDHARWR